MSLKPVPVHVYHVFLASPGDVNVERQHVRRFFDDYNRHTAHLWNARFEVIDWENYATIGVGRPQELITLQTLEKFHCSLVVGIMAQRFGTPSGNAESGTEEEFNHAKQCHDKTGFPEIKWFFRKIDKLELPANPDEADTALDQWKKVIAFRKRIQNLNDPIFCTEYPGVAGFRDVFENDLNLWLNDPMRPWASQITASGQTTIAGELPAEFNSELYRTAVLKRFDKLNLEMVDSTGAYYSLRLWTVFVPQSARECHQYNPRLLEIPKEHQERLLKAGEISEKELADSQRQAEKMRREYFQQPLRPVLEIADQALRDWQSRQNHRLVILGDPGSGKSSLIRYLALRWASIVDRTTRDAQPIPLVIDLGRYGQWKCEGRKGFVRFLEEAPVWHGWPSGLLERLLAQLGRIVLLLDGLDEIFDPLIREAVVDDIQRFSTEHPQTPIVVTSRIVGYQSQRLRDAEFRHFMLQDLDAAQIDAFIDRWHEQTFDDAAQAAPKLERLKKAIRDSKSIAMLAGNPLLLTMMAILNRNQELPRDRVDLYAQATRLLLHQWDTERALADFPGLSTDIGWREKHDLLRRIASFMQAGPSGLKGNMIDGPTLTSLIEDYLQTDLHFPQSRAAARVVVEHLRQRNFILCFVGADSYGFVHRTFLEYFCAADFVHQFNITKTLDEAGLLALFDRHCRDDDWREVLRLICSQIDEQFVGKSVEHLAMRTDLDTWDGKTPLPELPLAIWCLSEARVRVRLAREGTMLFDCVLKMLCRVQDYNLSNDLLPATRAIGMDWPGKPWMGELDVLEYASRISEDACWMWSDFVAAIQQDRAAILKMAVQDESSIRSIALSTGAISTLSCVWRDDATYQFLLQQSHEGSPQHQSFSLEMLATGWPTKLIRDLVELRIFTDENENIRRGAVEILAKTWPNDETRAIVEKRAVADTYEFTRGGILAVLAKTWPDPKTQDFVTARAVDDESEHARAAAIHELADLFADVKTRCFLLDRAVHDHHEHARRSAYSALSKHWPDESSFHFIRGRALNDPNRDGRGGACLALGKQHSKFGSILYSRFLVEFGPGLDPLEPIPHEHINMAAAEAGVAAADLEAQIASLNQHLGWDIRVGARPAAKADPE